MLRLEGLTTGYRSRGRTYAVSPQLEGELPEGRLTCLVGTNGAGKSTLLRTMAGLLPPLGGRVSVGGRALDALSPAERARATARAAAAGSTASSPWQCRISQETKS